LVVQSWSEAPSLIRTLTADAEALEEKRVVCANWWRTYKSALVGRVRDHVLNSITLAGA
jgi:hypothetical protein